MALRPSTRTFAQVRRAVKRTFGDEAGVQLEDADIVQWANDAQQAINTKNKIFKARSTSVSVPGQGDYEFPVELIQQVESLTYDGSPLRPVDIATAQTAIQGSDPHSQASGTPVAWYEWAGNFVLYPTPDDAKEIALYYTRYPAPLTGDDAQLLDVPDKYYQAVVDYILWKCYEMDEDWNGAQMKESHFRGALEEQSEEERESAHMTYPVISDWFGW